MMKKFLVAAAVAVSLTASAQATELLTNGSFETGDFTGWTALTAPGSNGGIEVISGAVAPNSNLPIVGPSEGGFHAVTGQNGPGAYALSQGVSLTGGETSLILSFDIFAVTDVPLVDDGNLDFNGAPNQHARVDIIAPGAGFGTDGGSVIASVLAPFITSDFANIEYETVSLDILPLLAGITDFEIRFAQADNQFFFSLGVDNVSLISNTAVVPLPAAAPLMIAGLAGLGFMRRRRA